METENVRNENGNFVVGKYRHVCIELIILYVLTFVYQHLMGIVRVYFIC